ncbi:hypothetical protein D3C78_1417370 [compost metagenome]
MSVTAALLNTAASLLPLMVTVTLVVVPSALVTTKVSVRESPAFSSLKAELATKVQLPVASMLKLPYWPAVPVWATKVAGLSTSLMVRVPPVVSGAPVSVSWTLSLPRIAASLTGFTPMTMVMVSVPPLPSSTMAVKLSLPLKSPFGV